MQERKESVRVSTKRKTAKSLEWSMKDKIMVPTDSEGNVSESTYAWQPEYLEEDFSTKEVLPKQEKVVLPKQEVEEGDSGEFLEPFSLKGIPKLLRTKMYKVAPILRGRDAVYSEEFFREVVGLCNEGCEVDKAFQETEVTAEEVLAKWKPADKHRFPIANCLDREQALYFGDHYTHVYGGRPNNESFSWKFLTACFATFVHHCKVNWAVEATKRRQLRVDRSTHNPQKLGPTAICQQVGALCSLIAEYAQSSRDLHGTRENNTTKLEAEKEMHTCSKQHVFAREAHSRVVKRLEEARVAFGILCSEEDLLQQAWGVAIAACKSLKQQGLLAEANEKNKEARILLCKVKEHIDKQEMAESELKKLEAEELQVVEQELNSSTEKLLAAKEKLRLAQLSSLVLHPKQAFPLWPTDGQIICPRCCKEFDGPMLTQWEFSLTEEMQSHVQDITIALENRQIPTDGDIYCKSLEEATAEPEPSAQSKRHKTMPPPTTPTGLEIVSYKSLPLGVESPKPQTPTEITVSMKSKSPNDMHFRVTNRGQEDTDKSKGPTSLTDLGYSSTTMIELFPQRRSLFQAGECTETCVVGTTSQVLDGENEKVEITISRICDNT